VNFTRGSRGRSSVCQGNQTSALLDQGLFTQYVLKRNKIVGDAFCCSLTGPRNVSLYIIWLESYTRSSLSFAISPILFSLSPHLHLSFAFFYNSIALSSVRIL